MKFPKREKVNKRHMMMAGSGPRHNEIESVELDLVMRDREKASSGDESLKSYSRVQMDALKDIFSEKINVTAFVLVPLGQFVKYMEYSPGAIFCANFCAIIPLA